jgi:hypothetical protein
MIPLFQTERIGRRQRQPKQPRHLLYQMPLS